MLTKWLPAAIIDREHNTEEKRVKKNLIALTTILVLAFGLAACDSNSSAVVNATPTAVTTSSDAAFSKDVSQQAALDLMHGHLIPSLALWQKGNYKLAVRHAGHPANELFAIVADELKAKNADVALKKALDSYVGMADRAGNSKEVQATQEAAIAAINQSLPILNDSAGDNLRVQAASVREMLTSIINEYTGASVKTGDDQLIEYGDSVGYVQVAALRYQKIAGQVKAQFPSQAAVIEQAFAELKALLTDPTAVPNPLPPLAAIKSRILTINSSLSDSYKLPAQQDKASVVIARVKQNVDEAVKQYKAGDKDKGYQLAADAYLNGYDKLEGDIALKDIALSKTVETQLIALRNLIRNGKPISEVEDTANQVKKSLDQVDMLLMGQ